MAEYGKPSVPSDRPGTKRTARETATEETLSLQDRLDILQHALLLVGAKARVEIGELFESGQVDVEIVVRRTRLDKHTGRLIDPAASTGGASTPDVLATDG